MAKKIKDNFNINDYYTGEQFLPNYDTNFKERGSNKTANLEYGIPFEDYVETIGRAPNIYLEDVQSLLAENQSTGAKMLGTLNQSLIGEVVGGTIEGIGHLVDIEQTINVLEGDTQEWGNWITDIGKSLRTWAEETTPVYTDPTLDGKFAPGRADWWYTNVPSMFSTFSLLIPAAGAVRGASLLGKLTNISSKLGKTTKFMTKGISQAVASRLMENGMESLGTYDEMYQDLLSRNIPEEEAKRIASEAASNTWNANWAMLVQDIPQYLLLNKAFGKATEDITSGMAKQLGKSTISPTLTRAQAIGLDALGEAGEEGYQFLVAEEFKNLAEVRAGLREPTSLDERLQDYLKDGELWTSMSIGAIGGAAMQTLGRPVNRAITEIKGGKSREQFRVENIGNWSAERAKWAEDIKRYRESGEVFKEKEATDNMITALGVQAAQLGNLGSLRETLQKVSEEDPKAMELMGITAEELPNIKQDFQGYFKKLDRIEELYNNYIKTDMHDKIVPLVVQMQSNLETKREIKNQLSKDTEKLKDSIANFDQLSSSGKSELTLKAGIKARELAIKNLQSKIKAQEKDLKSLNKALETEEDPKVVEALQNNIDLIEQEKFVNQSVVELFKNNTNQVKEELKSVQQNYSDEEKSSDKKLGISEQDYIDYSQSNAQAELLNSEIEKTQEYINRYKSKDFNKKFAESLKKKNINTIKDAIKDAESIEEVEQIKEQAKGNKTTEKAVDDAVKEAAEDESPDYEKRSFKEIYGDNLKSLLLDRIELTEAIEAAIPDIQDGDYEAFKNSNNVEIIDAVLDNIYGRTDEVAEKIKTILDQFYKDKAATDTITNKQNFTQAIADNEEGELETKDRETPIETDRLPSAATVWEMEMKDNKVVTKPNSKEPLPAKSKAITDKDYNPDIVNDPSKFGKGTQIFFEVNLNDKFNPLGEKGEPIGSFAIQVVAYENGTRRVLSLVPSLNAINQSKFPDGYNSLKKLREDVYKAWESSGKTKGIFKPRFSSTITEKHAGRIWVRDTYFKPHEIVANTNQRIIFGIVTEKAGQKVLEIPNAPKQYNKNFDATNLPAGAVYMMLPASNGEIIPFRMFTQKIGKFTTEDNKNKYANQIYKQIKGLVTKKTTGDEINAAVKEIQKIAFLKIEFKKESVIIYTKGKRVALSKEGIRNNDATTLENFLEVVNNLPLQVDINQINRTVGKKNYNEDISKEGRLTLNVNPKRWTHSTRFNIELNYTEQAIPKPSVEVKSTETGNTTSGFQDPNTEVKTSSEGDNINEGKPEVSTKSVTPFGTISDSFEEDPLGWRLTDKKPKEGIDFVFEQSPELANIGSPEQYLAYLETIFPDSKFKDILWHKSTAKNKFEKFDKNRAVDGVFFFNKDKSHYDNIIKEGTLINVIVDFKSPENVEFLNEAGDMSKAVEAIRSRDNDSAIDLDANEYIAFEPEQIHILGSKQDIEGFKEFVGVKPKETKVDEDLLNKEDEDVPDVWNRLAIETDYQKWDKAKEIAWFKENFPDVDIEVVDGLIEINRNGGEKAWGVFKNAMVYISNQAKVGTTYHEAFHAVFNMFLNNTERSQIYQEATERYGELSRLELEEKLADEFSDYVLSKELDKPTWGQKVVNFFKNLYQIIKHRLFGETSIDLIFRRANTGFYANKRFGRDISKFKTETKYKIVPGLTVEQQYRRITNIADSMRRYINLLSNKEENLNKTRSQIIKEYGINHIAQMGFKSLRKHYQNNQDKFNEDQKQQFTIMLNEFLTIDENLNPTDTFKELGKSALRQLAQSEGLKFNFEGVPVSNINTSTESEVFELDESEVKLEGWQVKVLEMSAKDRATGKMRSELSHIPQLTKEGTIKSDDIGLPVYLDFNEAFSTIIREVADNFNEADMLRDFELLAEAKPVFNSLLEKLKGDIELRGLFFQAFQNTFMDYKILNIEKDAKTGKNTFKWFSANRQGIINSIIDEWRNNYSDPDSNVLINGDTPKLKARYDQIKENITKNKFSETNIKDLSNLLNSVGINISLEELNALKELKIGRKDRLSEFYKNITPVLNRYFNEQNPYEGEFMEDTSLKAAAKQVKYLRVNLQESSHINVENKTVYANVVSNFIAKQTKEIVSEEILDRYMEVPFYKEMPWLVQMKNNLEFYQENFKYAVLDGLKESNTGTKYPDLSKKQLEIIKINAFLNNANKKGLSFYQMPILADAPNGVYIQAERFNNEQVVEFLSDVAWSEWARIQQVKNLEVEYDNFNKNGTKFAFIPILNKHVELFEKVDKEAIKNIIRDYLDNNVTKELADLTRLGILQKEGDSYTSGLIDFKHGFANLKELVKNYLYNSVLANTQMVALYQGDPTFYKNTLDFFKRAKEVWSPGLHLNVKEKAFDLTPEQASKEGVEFLGVRPTYITKYVEDVEYFSKQLGEDILNILLTKPEVTKIQAYEIAARYGYSNTEDGKSVVIDGNTFKTKKTNVTDAQAFISPSRYREIQLGLNRWNKLLQDTFSDIVEGKNTEETRNIIWQPIKPFVFTHSFENGLVVPIQNKNSEFVLLPSIAYVNNEGKVVKPTKKDREDNYSNFKSPVLARILDTMQRDSFGDTNYIDSIQFKSAVKVGASGVGTINDIESAQPHELSNRDYRLQQETPDHFTDDFGIIGTQIRKLIIGDISVDALFDLPEFPKQTRDRILSLYHSIVSHDVLESFDKIASRLQPPTDPNNVKEHNKYVENIQELLLEEVRSRNMGDEMEEALGTYKDQDGFKRFNLPLFHPLHAYRTESLIGSIYKNSVVKQKAPGGNVVQVSGVGFSDELEVVVNTETGAIEYFECYLPWWTQKYFEPLLDENGNIDINKLPDNLKNIIGYRIPTEDKYSMTPLRIKGFLPRTSGGSIMLPSEITTVTGSDFDIDKMYLMLPSFEISLDKQDIRKVEYDYGKPASEQSRKARDNAKLDIYWSILTNPDTFSRAINPGNFDRLKEFADEVSSLKGLKHTKMDLALPSTNREMFIRNMTGAALIGIFVNHSVNHAILQYTDVQLAEPIELNGQSRGRLNAVKNENNNYISRTLGTFVGAAADNAKEPVASDLNINTFTADILATILRTGYSLDTGLYFLNQPAIVDLVEEFSLLGNNSSEYNNAYSKVLAKYRKGTAISSFDLTKEQMKQDISGGEGADFLGRQTAVLELFDSIRERTFDIGKLINVLRADNLSRRITSASNEVFSQNVKDLEKTQTLLNVDTVWDKYPLIKAFYENSVVKTTEELNRIYPWNKPTLLNTKEKIKSSLPQHQRLTNENINRINLELLNFIANDFEFFSNENKNYIIKEFPAQFKKAINEKYPELKDNPLISRLRTVSKKVNGTSVDTIELVTTSGLSDQDKVKVTQAWNELLQSDKYKKLAENLVKYTYHAHGFVINPKTFSFLIPVEFYNNLKDSNEMSFNDYLNNWFEEIEADGNYTNFIDQFYRNNWENTTFVPSYAEEDTNKVPKGVTLTNNIPTTVKLTEKGNPNFVVKRSELPKKEKITMMDILLSKPAEFVPYITVPYKGKKYLFINMGYGQYERIEPLGLRNVVKEYDFRKTGLSSIFSENKVKVTEESTQKLIETSTEWFGKIDSQDINNLPDCI